MAQIWTDDQLNQWSDDALGQIASDVHCIYVREPIEIQKGNSFYELPPYVRTLRRVAWRGRSLFALSWIEMDLLAPTTSGFDTPIGVPKFYAMAPEAPYAIRLFPIPNESFSATGFDPYAPQPNQSNCIIDFYRVPEATGASALPHYIQRRTLKAYVLWKAFAAEGKGQDLKASQFYLSKYQLLIEYFRHINEGCFVAKRYSLEDATLLQKNFRVPKPVLNSNFERIYY